MDYKLLLEQLLNLTVWLPIKNYDNYEVSICGQVRNMITKQILKPQFRKCGYYYVNLYKNNKMKHHYIHRLVSIHFIPNINNDKCFDHINNNKLDNTVSNLRWCTFQQNQFNRQMNINNKSGIKGIYYNKNYQKWHVRIGFNNKFIHIGYYDDINDAKQARQTKANELYGDYINVVNYKFKNI